MELNTLKIGNMCCSRCITAVTLVLNELGIKYKKVELGCAVIYTSKNIKETELESAFKKSGFRLIKSKEEEISEKVKTSIHHLFADFETIDFGNFNLIEYLELQVQIPYKTLSDFFSKQNKKTIEHYFIRYKIEKVKSMISDSGYSFSEIAFKLGYHSLSHLSKQFKACEGVSMSSYKLKPNNRRNFIDKI